MKINNDSFKKFLSKVQDIVIDLGCGTSLYKEDILKLTKTYIGVHWGKRYHNQFKVNVFADLTKSLPFKRDYADTIISCQVMEHLPEPDFFLSECFRILKPGGYFLLPFPLCGISMNHLMIITVLLVMRWSTCLEKAALLILRSKKTQDSGKCGC